MISDATSPDPSPRPRPQAEVVVTDVFLLSETPQRRIDLRKISVKARRTTDVTFTDVVVVRGSVETLERQLSRTPCLLHLVGSRRRRSPETPRPRLSPLEPSRDAGTETETGVDDLLSLLTRYH